MTHGPPLAQRYLFGSKKRTTKADRAAKTASARAAKDAAGPSISAMDNASGRWALKRRLYDKQRYWEKDARKKRQKLKEAQETVRDQEKTIRQYEKTDVRHSEEIRVLNDQITGLQAQTSGYQKQVHALKARVKQIPVRIGTAIRWALGRAGSPARVPETYKHKKGGVISDQTRDCFMDLMALDHIPASRVASAFKRVASCLGIEVEDDVDRRSARRIQKEGGLAAKLQFAQAAKDAQGDGTSHKNEQYETRNATVITKEGNRFHFFLGVKMAVNHTSETQLDGLVEIIEELYQLLHDSGMATDADVREVWNLVTGFHSDHAEDQKKLFRLLKALKERMEREVRGERVLKSMGYTEVFNLAFKCGQQAVDKAGGPAKWDAMSHADQSHIY
ncbi:hypothetical protein B0H14DRAFT_3514663 [Mycena olivaceomarginata]|nr:hypothetical protein B0H14DRAFT_3514663 [Mycena olivaceomarginata]